MKIPNDQIYMKNEKISTPEIIYTFLFYLYFRVFYTEHVFFKCISWIITIVFKVFLIIIYHRQHFLNYVKYTWIDKWLERNLPEF